jgi:hypothetical protein
MGQSSRSSHLEAPDTRGRDRATVYPDFTIHVERNAMLSYDFADEELAVVMLPICGRIDGFADVHEPESSPRS